jgi:DNA-3-methyladenine glycosylase I
MWSSRADEAGTSEKASATIEVGAARPVTDLVTGSDGRARCGWAASSPLYVTYHDEEWGRPVHGDARLYERLVLEAFQSGLAWITVLRKREAFRRAFRGFVPELVAQYDESDISRLLEDDGIIRNRAKIEAAIVNAQRVVDLDGGLDALLWSYAPAATSAPLTLGDVPATTPESTALAKDLRRRGFRFVGPTTAYAAMQACGLVNDHLAGCFVRGELSAR